MKGHSRQLLKRCKKRVVRRPCLTGHKPPFWFERQAREIRAAQMEKYRQMRPKPAEPVYRHSALTITMADYEDYTVATSSGWRK